MDIRVKIIRKIKENGYSARQVGRISDVSNTTISSFLTGKKIFFENFIKIVDSLDFSPQELNEIISLYEIEVFGKNLGSLSKHDIEFEEKKLRLKELEKSLEIGELQNKIPVYSCVSAGVGCIPDAEPIDWVVTSVKDKNLKATVVNGKSMEPFIRDKSIVIFTEDEELRNRDIGVFILEGEGFVKRILKRGDEIMLLSDNNDYDPITIHEYDDFKICGKVIKVLSDV